MTLALLLVLVVVSSGSGAELTISLFDQNGDPLRLTGDCYERVESKDAPFLPPLTTGPLNPNIHLPAAIGNWAKVGKRRVYLKIVSLDGAHSPVLLDLADGQSSTQLSFLPPGRYFISAQATLQFEDEVTLETPEKVPPPGSTEGSLSAPPYVGYTPGKGQWEVCSLERINRPLRPNARYQYVLKVRYTYVSATSTVTYLEDSKPDRAALVLLTDLDLLGAMAGNGSFESSLQETLKEDAYEGGKKAVTIGLSNQLQGRYNLQSAAGTSLLTSGIVNFIEYALSPEAQRDPAKWLTRKTIMWGVGYVFCATVSSSLVLNIGVAILTKEALDAIEKDVAVAKLSNAVAAASFDDIPARVVRDAEGKIARVECQFRGLPVWNPTLAVEMEPVGPEHSSLVPLITKPGISPPADEWLVFEAPEGRVRGTLTNWYDSRVYLVCDIPISTGITDAKAHSLLKPLVVDDSPAPDTTGVEVITAPPGAQVWLDGVQIPGLLTPLVYGVGKEVSERGSVLVRVELSGYHPAERQVRLAPDRTTRMTITLVPLSEPPPGPEEPPTEPWIPPESPDEPTPDRFEISFPLAVLIDFIAAVLGMLSAFWKTRVVVIQSGASSRDIWARIRLHLAALLALAVAVAVVQNHLWAGLSRVILAAMLPLVALAVMLVGFGLLVRPVARNASGGMVGAGLAVFLAAILVPGVIAAYPSLLAALFGAVISYALGAIYGLCVRGWL